MSKSRVINLLQDIRIVEAFDTCSESQQDLLGVCLLVQCMDVYEKALLSVQMS